MDREIIRIQDEMCYLEVEISNLEHNLKLKKEEYAELENKLKAIEKPI